jgi:hypothetical protein
MSKYELSLSKDYVIDWTVVDSIRELFQNALDQETMVENNKMFFNYDAPTECLYIGNKASTLEYKSLLLGVSTKRDNEKTVGKFGEGYKIATLVLLRLGKKMTIYNYGAKEVWTPKFVKSRRYGAEILTFFVDKNYFWTKVPDKNLTIKIEGITAQEFVDIVKSNLHLQDSVGTHHSSIYGKILMEPRYKGKVFINGLYVCTHNDYEYGYDFKPEYLNLDRDRKLVNNFELQWLSSKMWSGVKNPIVLDLIIRGCADTAYVSNQISDKHGLHDTALADFRLKYGDKAVPVADNEQLKMVPSGYEPVMVNSSYRDLIIGTLSYTAPPAIPSLRYRMEVWLLKYGGRLPSSAVLELDALIKEVNK